MKPTPSDGCRAKPIGPLHPEAGKVLYPLFFLFCFRGGKGGAEVEPTRRTRPGIILLRPLLEGSWVFLNLSDYYQLPYLSCKLRRLMVHIVGVSKTRRPGTGEITGGGFTYYWSDMSNRSSPGGGYRHLQPTGLICGGGYSD